jgi:hypothetical protein
VHHPISQHIGMMFGMLLADFHKVHCFFLFKAALDNGSILETSFMTSATFGDKFGSLRKILTATPMFQGSFVNSHNGGGCMLLTISAVYLGTPRMMTFNNSCRYAVAYTAFHDLWNPLPLFMETRSFGNTGILTLRMVRRESRK